tara:strand:+ start:1740 stop:3245 length:1506 start_codon:yes stop_codon:yes gene_type:complete
MDFYRKIIEKDHFILILILSINVLALISTLDNTYTDGWNLRQAQTAIMTKNIFLDNFNIFPTRLTFFAPFEGKVILEFPIIHYITALTYKFFSISELNGRTINLLFYLLNGLLFWNIQNLYFNQKISIINTTLFISSPLILYTAHAYIPETSMMTFYLSAYYFFAKTNIRKRSFYEVFMLISLSLASLAKPLSIIIYFPIFIYYLFNKDNVNLKIKRFILLLLSLCPLILWIIYAKQINSSVLSTGSNWGDWSDIIFGRGGMVKNWLRFDFWRNIIFNFNFLLLNPITLFITLISITKLIKDKNQDVIFHKNWIIGNCLALFILAGPNRGHPYYQIYFVPPLLFFVGYYLKYNLSLITSKNKFIKLIIIINFLISISIFSYGANENFRISNIAEFNQVFQKYISISKNIPSEYILYATEGMTSGVYDYYGGLYSSQFKIRDENIAKLENKINSGAKYIFFINTKYGNTINKLRYKNNLDNWLNDNKEKIYESESILLYKLR